MATDDNEAIDLAHTPDFTLGRLSVRPSVRQLVRDDGENEIVEPRVMQVLLALVRAEGNIITRDELTRWCWDDRVVGEDAINRVISRLRRTAEGIGAGSFRIETITKVGYRLLSARGAAHPEPGPPATAIPSTPSASALSRRGLIGGGAALTVAALAGGVYLWRHHNRGDAPTPQSAALLAQALLLLRQDTHEAQNQAIALLRHAVDDQPDFADGWGALAMAYAFTARYRPSAQALMLRRRADEAILRAQALDARNAYAALARATNEPARGRWLETERALRGALRQHPGDGGLSFSLAYTLSGVGREREAAEILGKLRQAEEPNPGIYFREMMSLWAANEYEALDRLTAEASQLYPSQFSIWFARVYIQMYSGRPAAAIALIDDIDNRPTGIATDQFQNVRLVAQALVTHAAADADKALAVWLPIARTGAGHAENAIQFAVALGRLDDAFALIDAYYFGRGFTVPEVRFSVEQGTYTAIGERLTFFLFAPSTAPMRADPRFAGLLEELGLERYWREAGVQPDYRR